MTTRTTLIRPLAAILLGLFLLAGTACDKILEVENPGSVTEEGLASQEALPVLVSSAYGDLVNAFDNLVLISGLFVDELTHSGSFPNFRRMDNRATVENDFLGDFQRLSTARFLADLAVDRIRDEGGSQALLAEALAYAGWSRLFLAEHFCEITIAGGPILSPQQVFQEAEGKLGEAIQTAQGAGADDILNLARVGRARVRLALGDDAGALADAQAVPADFVFLAIYSVTANSNTVWVFTVGRRETAIEEPFRNDPDIPQCSVHPSKAAFVPACPFPTEGPLGPDNETPLFVPLIYVNEGDDIPLASGVMAQHLAAEAAGNLDERAFAEQTYLTANRMAFLRRNNLIEARLGPGETCWTLPERERDTNPNT